VTLPLSGGAGPGAPADGPALLASGVEMRFRLVHERSYSLKDYFVNRKRLRRGEDFYAVRGVSLEVGRGEILGIIGRNGSGKTTLLRIFAGVLFPTAGRVVCNGRVASLIDLGAGFVPDLTGAENIYLSGAMLGLSRKETSRQFDRIVQFAELEEFIDTPIKNYSSGMYARLGFAIATDVDAEILLIDEVLAVGDAPFQEKCHERMAERRAAGKTIVIVSHDLALIEKHCDRALLMEAGRIVAAGPPAEVVARYREG
jgi:ABC-type polysaccharide/polyol phosphate transport system ATPase subunit